MKILSRTKVTDQRKLIETAVAQVFESAQTMLSWTQADKDDFIRDVEKIRQAVSADEQKRLKNKLMTQVAFHFTTSVSPSEDEIAKYHDVAATYVDNVLSKLQIAGPQQAASDARTSNAR